MKISKPIIYIFLGWAACLSIGLAVGRYAGKILVDNYDRGFKDGISFTFEYIEKTGEKSKRLTSDEYEILMKKHYKYIRDDQ